MKTLCDFHHIWLQKVLWKFLFSVHGLIFIESVRGPLLGISLVNIHVLHLSFAILCKCVLLESGAKNKCDFVTCVAKKLNYISLLHPTIQ